jgi:hypothetical protein
MNKNQESGAHIQMMETQMCKAGQVEDDKYISQFHITATEYLGQLPLKRKGLCSSWLWSYSLRSGGPITLGLWRAASHGRCMGRNKLLTSQSRKQRETERLESHPSFLGHTDKDQRTY